MGPESIFTDFSIGASLRGMNVVTSNRADLGSAAVPRLTWRGAIVHLKRRSELASVLTLNKAKIHIAL